MIDTTDADTRLADIAAAIGEPTRARMLRCLLDGRARTGTELSLIADLSPSTASSHLSRLVEMNLLRVLPQGRHRYYSIKGAEARRALEALLVMVGAPPSRASRVPPALRAARSCYDHIAGGLAVSLHDALAQRGWIRAISGDEDYEISTRGVEELRLLDIDAGKLQSRRRRVAFACLDWSERRPHVGGSLGAALLEQAVRRKWLLRVAHSRRLQLTSAGRREFASRFGIEWR
jgi:DNA-binding transcriptional ArsR family regulator